MIHLNFKNTPYRYFLLNDDTKVNHILVRITYWIFFFIWRKLIQRASFIEIYSMNDVEYAKYLCGLIKGKYNVDIPIVLLDDDNKIKGYIFNSGESYNKGLKGEKFGKKIMDEGTAYLRRGKRPGLAPSL